MANNPPFAPQLPINAPPPFAPPIASNGGSGGASSYPYLTGGDLTTLQIGNIVFHDFEIPSEAKDWGSELSYALHKFAGGVQSAQVFGSYPAEKSWTGILQGLNAHQRAQQLELLCTNGQGVDLNYSVWSFNGLVKKFGVISQGLNWVAYDITFECINNNNNDNQGAAQPNNQNNGQLAQQQLNQAAQQAAAPNTPSGFTFPAPLVSQVQQVVSAVKSAISQVASAANLTLGQISSFTQQINGLISQVTPFLGLSDPNAAAAGNNLIASLTNVLNQLTPVTPVIKQITLSNPNLFQLASVYYGDASQWMLIYNANPQLQDPQPMGTYTLNIPIAPPQATQ